MDIVVRMVEREFLDAAGRDAVLVTDLDAFFAKLAARGFVLGVATMDSEAAAGAALDRLGAGRHLAFLCGGGSGWGTKPGPGMVHPFLAAAELRAGEVMVVGNTPHDMEMGRAVGAVGRSGPVRVTRDAGNRIASIPTLPP